MMHRAEPATRITLRGYKDIARALQDVWGIDVSRWSISRWAQDETDPLPLKRIRANRHCRALVLADREDLTAWARRRVGSTTSYNELQPATSAPNATVVRPAK